MSKIIAIVRTRNEEKNIARYCRQHDFADEILVADGGSTDKTIEIAKQFANVKVRAFDEEIKLENNYTRNPDWKHINFLIEWAEEEGADWIVMDDCDTNPNYLLYSDARTIMEESLAPYVNAVQIHLWGEKQYFPALAQPDGGGWRGGIWAWRADKKLRAYGEPPHFMFKSLLNGDADIMVDFDKEPSVDLLPSYCRIHAVWEDIKIAREHVEMYRKSGLISNMLDPTAFAGYPLGLEEWMRYGD